MKKEQNLKNRKRNILSPTSSTGSSSGESTPKLKENKSWGRNSSVGWLLVFGTSFVIASVIFGVNYFWTSCTHFDCELRGPIDFVFNSDKPWDALYQISPKYSHKATMIYIGWLIF